MAVATPKEKPLMAPQEKHFWSFAEVDVWPFVPNLKSPVGEWEGGLSIGEIHHLIVREWETTGRLSMRAKIIIRWYLPEDKKHLLWSQFKGVAGPSLPAVSFAVLFLWSRGKAALTWKGWHPVWVRIDKKTFPQSGI